jgi:lactoylglutathione lyase
MIGKLSLVIQYVDNMENAVRFYREVLGLPLRSQSHDWTEFETGDTVLALHAASATFPAGSCELHFTVDDVRAFYEQTKNQGVKFVTPPTLQPWGSTMAEIVDSQGGRCSVSSP